MLSAVVVSTSRTLKSPISRHADADLWERNLKKAVLSHFDPYKNGKNYGLAISIEGYALAPPGIPLIFSPKSFLMISVHLWDNISDNPLNERPFQIVIFEDFSVETLVGSGLLRSTEEQVQILSKRAAKRIERWLHETLELRQKGVVEKRDLPFRLPHQ